MAAFEAFKAEFGQRLGPGPAGRANTRARRYVSRQLTLAVRAAVDDPDEMRRLEVLRRIFSGDLLPHAENALGEIRDLRLEGRVLHIRLEALRERYRLNSPRRLRLGSAPEPEVIRIVCSDGLG